MSVALIMMTPAAMANDSDASVGLGGVQLTHEPRIFMESERLTISLSKITVEYEFLNESDHDITTEVAFPIPSYAATMRAGGTHAFDDFKLWVDEQPMSYATEAKAFLVKRDETTNQVLSERDVTALLTKYKIDIPTIGHYLESKDDSSPDFVRLDATDRKRLSDAGLFDMPVERAWPWWEVRKTYHWRQTFPAHKMLRIRHEYTPGFGFTSVQADKFAQSPDKISAAISTGNRADESSHDDERLLRDSCVTPALRHTIAAQSGYAVAAWVDYILTTANSWKTPIKRFDLVIEQGPKPLREGYSNLWNYASFCWDGAVRQVDTHRFQASATDFVPRKELKVLFLTLSASEVAPDVEKQPQPHLGLVTAIGLGVLLLCTWAGLRRFRAGT